MEEFLAFSLDLISFINTPIILVNLIQGLSVYLNKALIFSHILKK